MVPFMILCNEIWAEVKRDPANELGKMAIRCHEAQFLYL